MMPPAAPNTLSSKTLSNVSSTGTSSKAHGFTENTSGAAGISTGDTVNRVTTGTATAAITSFAYNADSGTLTATVNGSADGQKVLTW